MLVIILSLLASIYPSLNISIILFSKSSIPSLFLIEVWITSIPSKFSSKSYPPSKSILFNKTIDFLSLIRSKIFLSSSSNSLEESKIAIIKSESEIKDTDFSTPIFSTISSVSLIPAVSLIFRLIPSKSMYSSMTSRVVPGISVTIALFSFNKAFNKEDLPTFGLPIIVVLIPSLIILPLFALSESFLSLSKTSLPSFKTGVLSNSSCISSVKLIEYSTWDSISNNWSLNCLIFLLTLPSNCFILTEYALSVFALIISIIASAWDKSILPFKKALLVNSPASASLAPLFNRTSNTFLTATTPPWV